MPFGKQFLLWENRYRFDSYEGLVCYTTRQILYVFGVFLFWASVLLEDGVTGTVHCCKGLLKTGPNFPVLTCLTSHGELGRIPLKEQTVLWLGHHALTEDSNLLSIPGTGSPHHGVICREDWEILMAYSSNNNFILSHKCPLHFEAYNFEGHCKIQAVTSLTYNYWIHF